MTRRVVVPVEPTREMHAAGVRRLTDNLSGIVDIYGDMIAIVPPYEPSDAEVEASLLAFSGRSRNSPGTMRAALIAADKARRG